MAVFWHNCLAGLLSGSCSDLLPDVLTWVCTIYTQDLKPYTQAIVYHRNQRNQKKEQSMEVHDCLRHVETYFFVLYRELDAKAEEQCADSKAEEQCADNIEEID